MIQYQFHQTRSAKKYNISTNLINRHEKSPRACGMCSERKFSEFSPNRRGETIYKILKENLRNRPSFVYRVNNQIRDPLRHPNYLICKHNTIFFIENSIVEVRFEFPSRFICLKIFLFWKFYD